MVGFMVAMALSVFELDGATCSADVEVDGSIEAVCVDEGEERIRVPSCTAQPGTGPLVLGTCCFPPLKTERAVCAKLACFPGKGCSKQL